MRGRVPPSVATTYNPVQNLVSFLEYQKAQHVSPRDMRGLLRCLGLSARSQHPGAVLLPPDMSLEATCEREVCVAHELLAWCPGRAGGNVPDGSGARLALRRGPRLRQLQEPGRLVAAGGAAAAWSCKSVHFVAVDEHPDVAALRCVMSRCARRGAVLAEVTGAVQLTTQRPPCIAALADICQLAATMPGVRLELAFSDAQPTATVAEAKGVPELHHDSTPVASGSSGDRPRGGRWRAHAAGGAR
mmetsp:Transcript_40068/g.127525  ORF Transcript_40068/g.127525 Transcript_40068/m.127525 type:complete len:245 (+) Transcript_40068:464-1198(+)